MSDHCNSGTADRGEGEHLCLLYETEAERWNRLTPFLLQGLEQTEKVLYVFHHSPEPVLDHLRTSGLDIRPYLTRGQLVLLATDDAYLQNGQFHPQATVEHLSAATRQAQDAGYTRLRATGEMAWSLRGPRALEQLLEYETLLDQALPGSNCLALCQYDRRQFAADTLLDLLGAHSAAMLSHQSSPRDVLRTARGSCSVEGTPVGHEHARQELGSRQEELAVLNAIAATVSQSLDLATILQEALCIVLQLGMFRTKARGVIFLLDEEAGVLSLAARQNMPAKHPCFDEPLPLGECLCGLAAQTGTVISCDYSSANGRHSRRSSYMPPHRDLCLPLNVRGKVLGVLNIWLPAGCEINRNDMVLLTSISEQIGMAVENARLYGNLQQQLTLLRDTQAQLVQSAKMAALGEMAAGVAHELNNPLTSVLGFAELLAAELPPESDWQTEVQTISREAARARDIVQDLLNFARQTPARREAVDPNRIVQETLALIRQRLEKEKITVEPEYAADVVPLLLDAAQMKQVLLNLLINALQAMPGGGRLAIHSQLIGREVAIAISDSGAGIPAPVRERIFEPFFTTKPTGTGLGLSISLGIVQQHGGRITVESEEGRGSTFTVWLPADHPAEE